MTYQFAGQTFASLLAFKRAFPAYRTYTDLIKKGITSVDAMEKEIRERHERGRRNALAQAKKKNTFTITRRKS